MMNNVANNGNNGGANNGGNYTKSDDNGGANSGDGNGRENLLAIDPKLVAKGMWANNDSGVNNSRAFAAPVHAESVARKVVEE